MHPIARPGEGRVEESDVERRIVRHEGPAGEQLANLRKQIGKRRGVGDVGIRQAVHENRSHPAQRIDEALPFALLTARFVEQDDSYLDDAIAHRVEPRRFDVDDGIPHCPSIRARPVDAREPLCLRRVPENPGSSARRCAEAVELLSRLSSSVSGSPAKPRRLHAQRILRPLPRGKPRAPPRRPRGTLFDRGSRFESGSRFDGVGLPLFARRRRPRRDFPRRPEPSDPARPSRRSPPGAVKCSEALI